MMTKTLRVGCLLSLIALPALGASAVAGFFFYAGQANHWTSDGPGMLGVMLGFAGAGLVALLLWAVFATCLAWPKARAWLAGREGRPRA